LPINSIVFKEEVEKQGLKAELKLDIIDDEPSEHGFDSTWTLKDKKLTDRLDWLKEVWLA
jgi:hypothetical protein